MVRLDSGSLKGVQRMGVCHTAATFKVQTREMGVRGYASAATYAA